MIKLTISDLIAKNTFRTHEKIRSVQDLTNYFTSTVPNEIVYQVDHINMDKLPVIQNFMSFIQDRQSIIESVQHIFAFESKHFGDNITNLRYFNETTALGEDNIETFYKFYDTLALQEKINLLNALIFLKHTDLTTTFHKIINVKVQSLYYKSLEDKSLEGKIIRTNDKLDFFKDFIQNMYGVNLKQEDRLSSSIDARLFYATNLKNNTLFYQNISYEDFKVTTHTVERKGDKLSYFINNKKVEKPSIRENLYKQILLPIRVQLEIKLPYLENLIITLFEDKLENKLKIKITNKTTKNFEINSEQLSLLRRIFGVFTRTEIDTDGFMYDISYSELSYKISSILETNKHINILVYKKKEKNIEVGDNVLTNNKKQAIVIRLFNTNKYKKDSLILLQNEKSGRKFLKYEKDVIKILKKNENKTVKQTTKPQTVKNYFEGFNIEDFYEPVGHIQEQPEAHVAENATEQLPAGSYSTSDAVDPIPTYKWYMPSGAATIDGKDFIASAQIREYFQGSIKQFPSEKNDDSF